jgi:hypothetical protein
VGVILFFAGRVVRVEPWQVGLALAPLVVLSASSFPLVYRSWFTGPAGSWSRPIALGFFWLILAAWTFVIAGIYGAFVFRLW